MAGEVSRSQHLLAASGEVLRAAFDMRFVREVSDGTIGAQAYANYLLIEESFVRTATRLHGLAVWDAPSWQAVEDNARSVHALVGEQTEYFRTVRAAWPVPAKMTADQLARSRRLSDFALETAGAGGYAAVMTMLFAAESLYYGWCSRAREQARVPAGPVADWVALHAAEPFHAGVRALGAAVDQLPAEVPDHRLCVWFTGLLEAEITFHDSVFG
jgi:thiaminase/transcriptional activator TenA